MKRRSRRQTRRKSNQLDFQKLEPKQLLAGDFMGAHQAAGELPTSANLVANGDFENVTPGADNFYTQNEVEGWSVRDSEAGIELNIFTSLDGHGAVLDLDSTVADFDRVYQNVPTVPGADYLITFDFRNHPTEDLNATTFTHDFEIWWNGSKVGRYTGGDYWHTGTIQVTGGAGATTELLFCEIPEAGAPGGDGRGALLDNIRVVRTNEISYSNLGFETTAEDKTLFYRPADVDGWNAMGVEVTDRWLKIVTSENGIPEATEGNQYLNLDATELTRDIIFRDLETKAGVSYYVTFDYRTDGSQATSPDELRVRWNQSWAGTFIGSEQWQSVGMMLTADSDLTRLTFLEPGETTGDGSGPLIDNVRIYQVLENDIRVDANGITAGTDGDALYIPGAGAQPIGQQITLSHDSGTQLTSVSITLDGVVDGINEIISISTSALPNDEFGNPKITVLSYNSATRQLNLTGSATVEEYQTLLRTLTYYNAASVVTTSNRTVTVTAFDSALPPTDSSDSASIDLAIETDQATIDDTILQKYIADNNLDATEIEPGLYVVVDEPGTGQNPTINSTVRVKYSGYLPVLNAQNKLVDGAAFDFSSEDGATFALASVIRGWQLGIPVFKTGGSGKLLIASALGYGPDGAGDSIPPNSVLIFDVELKEIVA